jgi:hypothetical protein
VLVRRLALLALLVAGLCAAAALALFAYGLHVRPYGVVEAELLFEASRLRQGFPLYVDPAVGAWELGPPPSRYYVLYTPAWPWLLAHLGAATTVGMRTVGRVVNAVLYAGTLGVVTATSRRPQRLLVGTGALLALGFAMLAREATLATADMPAVALATLGLARSIRRGGLDPVSAALLAAAPLIKPSVLGLPVGAVLAHLIVHRRGGVRAMLAPLVSGAVVAGGLMATFHVASGGAWLTHIVRATGQTLSLERWVQELGSRVVFLGAPHLAALVLAVRRRATPLGTVPLAVSLAWSTFSMAKHGSGTHYWLEPTMAALLALGAMVPAAAPSRALAGIGVAFTLAAAGVSLHELAGAPDAYRAWNDRVSALRDRCPLRPGEVLVATDASLEMQIDGRVIVPSWQSSYLVRSGTFPLEAWRRDLAMPEVRCFVDGPEFLAPRPERVEGITEVNAMRRELRDVIEADFDCDAPERVDGLLLYRRR